MTTPVTVNGTTYQIPVTNDENWGQQVTAWMLAVSQSTLQKNGGSFVLTAELDLGATYGVKAAYIKSRTANPATTGLVRMANNEGVAWRNAANSADLLLKVNASNALEFGGTALPTAAATVTLTGTQTLTNKTIVAASNTITTAASGNLAATSLNAALAELQADIDTRQPSDAELTNLATLSGTGLVVRKTDGTFIERLVAAGTGIAVTLSDGNAGNPTVAIDSTVATVTGSQTLTNKVLDGNSNTFNVRLGSDVSGTLLPARGGTGVTSLGTGVATFLETPSSANLAAAVTGETGSGALVFATSPALVTPTLGVATATSVNKVALTAPATAATLTIANNKTLTASNTLTFTGTDSSTVACGAGGTVAYSTTGSFTAYLKLATGASLTSNTVYWSKNGSQVTVMIPALQASTSGTALYVSDSNTATVLTWPAAIRPVRQQIGVFSSADGSVWTIAPILFEASGEVRLTADARGLPFSGATQVKGMNLPITITYMLD